MISGLETETFGLNWTGDRTTAFKDGRKLDIKRTRSYGYFALQSLYGHICQNLTSIICIRNWTAS